MEDIREKKNYGSVYGTSYPRYLLKYIDDYKRKVKILKLNALDGQHILLTSVRKGYEFDCYKSINEI